MSSQVPYKAPAYRETSFNCPFCNAFSSMNWVQAFSWNRDRIEGAEAAFCRHCDAYSIWYEEEMIYPFSTTIEIPNEDLPEKVKEDYLEASTILQSSPRGAAALLRLAIQKLCDELIAGDGDLNTKIGKLVEDGLHKKVQQALDIVRVIGNEAVHPGQIDLKDDRDTAMQLFGLVNIIAKQMITEPNEVDALYAGLPEAKRQQISKRDKTSS